MRASGRVRHPARARGGGFTLIELLVVVGIIAITAAVSLPQIARYIRNFRIKGAQRAVAGEIQTARAKAIMKNVQFGAVFVVVSPTQYMWVLEDMPTIHTRCRPSESAPCVANRMAEPSQHGPLQDLPRDVVFVTGTPTLPHEVAGCSYTSRQSNNTNVAVAFAGNDKGMRFTNLGTWCAPLTNAVTSKCPDLGTGLVNSVFSDTATATGSTGAYVCLSDRARRLAKLVQVTQGGRVQQLP